MRRTPRRVAGVVSKLSFARLSSEQQYVAMRNGSDPGLIAQARQSSCEVGQKQSRAVQTIALARSKDVFGDGFDPERLGALSEVADCGMLRRFACDGPLVDLPLPNETRTRAVPQLHGNAHVVTEWFRVQALLVWKRFEKLRRDQAWKQTTSGFLPWNDPLRIGARQHADDAARGVQRRGMVLVARDALEPCEVDNCSVVELDRELEV